VAAQAQAIALGCGMAFGSKEAAQAVNKLAEG